MRFNPFDDKGTTPDARVLSPIPVTQLLRYTRVGGAAVTADFSALIARAITAIASKPGDLSLIDFAARRFFAAVGKAHAAEQKKAADIEPADDPGTLSESPASDEGVPLDGAEEIHTAEEATLEGSEMLAVLAPDLLVMLTEVGADEDKRKMMAAAIKYGAAAVNMAAAIRTDMEGALTGSLSRGANHIFFGAVSTEVDYETGDIREQVLAAMRECASAGMVAAQDAVLAVSTMQLCWDDGAPGLSNEVTFFALGMGSGAEIGDKNVLAALSTGFPVEVAHLVSCAVEESLLRGRCVVVRGKSMQDFSSDKQIGRPLHPLAFGGTTGATAIIAPTGYGKSTLAADLCSAHGELQGAALININEAEVASMASVKALLRKIASLTRNGKPLVVDSTRLTALLAGGGFRPTGVAAGFESFVQCVNAIGIVNGAAIALVVNPILSEARIIRLFIDTLFAGAPNVALALGPVGNYAVLRVSRPARLDAGAVQTFYEDASTTAASRTVTGKRTRYEPFTMNNGVNTWEAGHPSKMISTNDDVAPSNGDVDGDWCLYFPNLIADV